LALPTLENSYSLTYALYSFYSPSGHVLTFRLSPGKGQVTYTRSSRSAD